MMTDFYEFTMANGFLSMFENKIAYFDLFYRKIPDGGGFAIVAGLEQVVEYLQSLHFRKKTLTASTARVYSPRASSHISGISNLSAMSGRFPRARRYFRANRF